MAREAGARVAKQYKWFLDQEPTPAELAAGFDAMEAADHALVSDLGAGVVSGAAVSQRGAGANMSVDITAGVVYDKAGARIAWGSTQNVSVATDYLGAATTIVTVGQSKKIAIFAKFKRVLTDERTDGHGDPVFYDQAEGFEFRVVQSAEAVSPTLAALDATYVLLADVTRAFGATTIVNANISIARRETYAPRVLGGTFELLTPTVTGQAAEILTVLNTKGKASGFASLDADGHVPIAQIPGYVIADVQAYRHNKTASGGTNVFSAATANAWTDTGATVTVPGCVAGDVVIIDASALAWVSTGTTGELRLVSTEAGGAATLIAGTQRALPPAGGAIEELPWYVAYTVAASGDLVVKVQAKSNTDTITVEGATILATRLS